MKQYSNEGDVLFYDKITNDELIKYIKDYVSESDVIKHQRIEYFNFPCSFDIETSSFYNEFGDKRGVMYEWTFGINGLIIIGRYWNQFIELCNLLSEILNTSIDKRLIIYIHNLSYEMQFIRKYFTWEKIFANEERKPFYAMDYRGLCFKCSYLLSGYSLAKIGELLSKYKVQKMVGDLDYKLIRHSETPLSDKELGYCINDVKVVMSYIQEKIESDGNIAKIPLTKTGYVRNYCRKRCFYSNVERKKVKFNYLKYRRFIESLTIDKDEYMMLKSAFMGGFTHASCYHSRKLMKDVHSYDFNSSYPSTMISEKYPMSKGEFVNVKTLKQFEELLKYYLCIFEIEFTDIDSTFPYEHYISSSKCVDLEEVVEDNGRIVYAHKLKTTITNIDYDIIKETYQWKEIRIGRFIKYSKGYLPKDLIIAVLDLYEKKTTLKGIEEKEEEYMNSKEMLNSTYGMMVTDIVRDEIVYNANDEWMSNPTDIMEQLEKYNKSKQRFSTYAWGVFIPTYARRNLWLGIKELKEDYIYSDTDSLKFTNLENHQQFFDAYNKRIFEKCCKCLNCYNIPLERISPKTKSGKIKPLGIFDYEGCSTYFKTIGAKRYMTFKEDKLSITISGVNKITATPFLLNKYKTIENCYKHFDDELVIPKDYSGKQIHSYIDEETSGDITDYLGNTIKYHEMSSIHLESAEYHLSLSHNYLEFLMGLND